MVYVRRRDTGVSRLRSGPTADRRRREALQAEQLADPVSGPVVAQTVTSDPEPDVELVAQVRSLVVVPGSTPTEGELWAMRLPELKTQAADEGISDVHVLRTKREIVTAILDSREASHGW